MQLTTSLPKEVVETQLARIIDSEQFSKSPRLSRFLTYVVEQALAGRRNHLKGYTIGVEVFDRPDDFDTQNDTIVRVQARALRQKLNQYYSNEGRDDPVHITIPKGSYEPAFHVSWDGEKPDDAIRDRRVIAPDKPSIAVLPFDDFCQTKADNCFSLGITEEVIANLSRFRDLAVFSRSTLQKIKLDGLDVSQIHDVLGADFVLEGSIRSDTKLVDVTINLIDASKDEIILTEHFRHDKTPAARHQLQDDLALMISARIADRYGPLGAYAERASRSCQTHKWETYYWISRYHQYAVQLSPAVRLEIKEGLALALEHEPESSDAHATMALIMADEYRMSTSHEDPDELSDRILKEAQCAVDCDPQSAIAKEALATAFFIRGDFESFDRTAKQALHLNPGHGDMLARLGLCYGVRANWQVAMPLLDTAITLNPLHPGWFRVVRAMGLCMTKSAAEAIAEMRAIPLPGVFFYHCHLVWFLVEIGDIEGALSEKRKLLKVFPDFENFAERHLRAWHVHHTIVERAYVAWRKVGLCVAA